MSHKCLSMLAIAIAGSVAGLAPHAVAAATTPRAMHFVVGAGSEVAYRLTVKTLLVLDEQIEGRDPAVRGDIRYAGSGSPTGWIEADVASFTSGNHTRDEHVTRILGASSWSTVRFDLASLDGFGADRPTGHVMAIGMLSAHGCSKAFRVPLDYRFEHGVLHIEGDFAARFSDFGIGPPVLGLVFKRSPDLLNLRVHLLATEAP